MFEQQDLASFVCQHDASILAQGNSSSGDNNPARFALGDIGSLAADNKVLRIWLSQLKAAPNEIRAALDLTQQILAMTQESIKGV